MVSAFDKRKQRKNRQSERRQRKIRQSETRQAKEAGLMRKNLEVAKKLEIIASY